jgi:preprotein translocase SecE subunit
MAVAVQPTTETKGASAPAPLWLVSLIGGLYVLGALAVVFYAVPKAWNESVSGWLVPAVGSFANVAFRMLAQVAAAVALIFVGSRLAGANSPKGIRGGIFWTVITIFVVFFLARMVGMWVYSLANNNAQTGLIGFMVAAGGFGFLGVRFLRSPRFARWAVGMEEAGWFRTGSYKRTQGLRIRRMTILGVLLLGGTGIMTMIRNGHLDPGDWNIVTPFLPTITLLPDLHLTGPLILGALGLWFAYRLVNYPTFADFLIATEAEMNKVSWTPRKRLIQDTLVVLTTVLILTLFLFVVDMFWGWFLSRSFIGVLPQTKHQYTVYVESIPDTAKKDSVIQALTESGIQPDTARRIVESVPQESVDAADRKAHRQVVRAAVPEEESKVLAHKLEEAGAHVARERGRNQQAEKPSW